MRILFSFLIVMTALFSPALAGDGPAVSAWKIVAENSALSFEGTQMGAPFKGVFKSFDGTIRFDPARLQDSNVRIAIDMDSVDADSADRNSYIRMPDWLNVAQFPEAVFTSTGFEKGLGPNQYVALGQLTIRGITLPITLPFTLAISKNDSGVETAVMTGETTVNRLDFGIGQGEWKDPKSVGAEIQVHVRLSAVRDL
ncbi:MAG TPA: YceI family protein [Micavibrio sp.]|jgi:cytochrome b561